MTWNELLGEAGHGEAAHTMNVADDDDLSDHDLGGAHPISPSGLGLGSPTHGLGGFHNLGNTSVEGQSPFDNLGELMVHHAHLAVFLNYVISNSDPAALVSTIKNVFIMIGLNIYQQNVQTIVITVLRIYSLATLM